MELQNGSGRTLSKFIGSTDILLSLSLLRRSHHETVEHFEAADGVTVFEHGCKLGLGGIVSKRQLAPHPHGRSRAWFKVESGTDPTLADFCGAYESADLRSVDLKGANLNDADLTATDLKGARFDSRTSLAGARLADTRLTDAEYAPASAPPDSYVAGITGLSTVTFPAGEETERVQLRNLPQKAGLRDLEREATFAIEHGNTNHSLDDWKKNPAGAAEGIFRYVAFDLTTRYGLRPFPALLLIAALWLLLIPIYAWPIWPIKRPLTRAVGPKLLGNNNSS